VAVKDGSSLWLQNLKVQMEHIENVIKEPFSPGYRRLSLFAHLVTHLEKYLLYRSFINPGSTRGRPNALFPDKATYTHLIYPLGRSAYGRLPIRLKRSNLRTKKSGA
jgi:hypothetical protein